MKQIDGQLLYIHIGRTTFVVKDMQLLSQAASLKEFAFIDKKKHHTFLNWARQLFFLLRYLFSARIYVAQFAGYHTLLPGLFARLLRRPFLIIASGAESASYPEISYGNYVKPLYAWASRVSFRLATHVAPVHESLVKSVNTYFTAADPNQGYAYHVKNLVKPYSVIPYGYDADKWQPEGAKEPRTFITVASIPGKQRFVLKGIDLIFAIAPAFPECRFTVVGMTYVPDVPTPPNVEVRGFVPNEQLPALCARHEFYLQLSISEGHPNALCEGMLCECVPIGSKVTSIPEIIGETGYLLEKRDEQALKELIAQAIANPTEAMGKAARSRIESHFPLSRRQQELKALLFSLTHPKA